MQAFVVVKKKRSQIGVKKICIVTSWKTWPQWNKGKLQLSKIVQETALEKDKRYRTDGQNTALICTITRPLETHQYWTVPEQTQRTTTPSFAKKCRLQYSHWRKGSQLELITPQWNLSKQVERTSSPLSRQPATRSNRQANGQLCGPSPWSSPPPPKKKKKAICTSARTTERSAPLATPAKSCWRSYWTDWSRKQRRSLLKNRQASEQEGAPQSRSLTYESSVTNITSTSLTSTRSS